MKKIIAFNLSLVLMILLLMPQVYATSSYKVDLNTTKNSFSKEEKVVVNVELSDINVEKGIIALGATLDYDKTSLELVEMKGSNNWSTPMYNEGTGKLVSERNGLTKNDEEMFIITFNIKESTNNQNPTISLKDIEASDGKNDIKTENIKKSITIANTPTPPPTPGGDGNGSGNGQNGSGNSQGGNSNGQGSNNQNGNVGTSNNNGSTTTTNNSSSNNKVKTPKSGDMLPIIAIGVILIVVLANIIIIFIRKKKKETENKE